MLQASFKQPLTFTPLPPATVRSSLGNVTVSVIVPALNEAVNLVHVLPWIPEWVHEVILVDGHSSDNTVEVAREIRQDIRIITQEGRGKGAALRTGIAAARGDIIVHIDADGSTDPTEIPAFVGALMAGADYAKGSRFLQGGGTVDMPLLRRIGNAALTQAANILFGTAFTDITYGYNAFWKKSADGLALDIDGWACEVINNIRAARNGLRVVEVASFEFNRIGAEAKLQTFSAGWTILKAIIRERLTPRRAQNVLMPQTKGRGNQSDNVFSDAMYLLFEETFYLCKNRDKFSPQAYDNALNVVEEAFAALLEVDAVTEEDKRLKARFRKFRDQALDTLLSHVQQSYGPYRYESPQKAWLS